MKIHNLKKNYKTSQSFSDCNVSLQNWSCIVHIMPSYLVGTLIITPSMQHGTNVNSLWLYKCHRFACGLQLIHSFGLVSTFIKTPQILCED